MRRQAQVKFYYCVQEKIGKQNSEHCWPLCTTTKQGLCAANLMRFLLFSAHATARQNEDDDGGPCMRSPLEP
ncbi:hypothetical protein EJB05_24292 [Eragrostis curvula]|uniref:Uncharacterized protein n=1 Tax=Eragrostis curvula TaxID=38414 RepID=A0A5J9V8W7_9POAL|nr:hypothetical protein EJB05_24292 [Eragrostis curvula]